MILWLLLLAFGDNVGGDWDGVVSTCNINLARLLRRRVIKLIREPSGVTEKAVLQVGSSTATTRRTTILLLIQCFGAARLWIMFLLLNKRPPFRKESPPLQNCGALLQQ
mmetsp:Transcript_5446/g.15339  ORF Transcript_5446/g.15339 Transcript_5446/m.15339 type:complete len:109 (+) Transcript_5446:4503-4829(+)